jgi:hypothetical protein
LGFIHPRLDAIHDCYVELRARMDPIPAFEQALADSLDDVTYDRAQSFFDGEHDSIYGPAAGERARSALREALEGSIDPDPRLGVPGGSLTLGGASEGEVVDVEAFYDENPVRRSSEEVSFGDQWRRTNVSGSWAVFWVVDTGELAALRIGPPAPSGIDELYVAQEIVRGLAHPKGPEVEVLRVDRNLENVRYLVGDWKHEQDATDSYGLLRQRLGLE